MKSLVTGGGGFLGRYIVEQLLVRGGHVRTFSRQPSEELAALGVESVSGDLCDREAVIAACRGMDVVFHVGGFAGISGPWDRYGAVNVWGTRYVVDGCLEHNVGRLVFTSSPSVTFDDCDQRGIDESTPYATRWLCHYARSKALAERHVLAANGMAGLLTCALRPHLIWGPRDRHLIPRLLERARTGRLRRVGDGSNLIDTVYVENAAEAHLLAADALTSDSPVAGQAYFISQGEPVNCWNWIGQILAIAGLPPVRKAMSLATARRLGVVYELLYRVLRFEGDAPMTRFLAAQLACSHYFDISRARRDFGYLPRISTEEGMRRLAESLVEGGVHTSKKQ